VLLAAGVAAAGEPPPAKLDAGQQAKLDRLQNELHAALYKGDFERVVEKAEEAAGLRQRWQGEKHWETSDAQAAVRRYRAMAALPEKDREDLRKSFALLLAGWKEQQAAKFAAAEKLFRDSLTLRRRVLGEEHPDTVHVSNELAVNLNTQGKYAEARLLLEKALAIRRQLLGEEHPDIATSCNNLAVNLQDQGKYAEAQRFVEKALAIDRKVFGEEHPNTATSWNNVAVNLQAQGKYAQAQPFCEKALAIRRKVSGEEHPDTAVSCSNLAANLQAQGKYAEAQPLCERALSIFRKALGEEHPHTAVGYNNLAETLNAQGKSAEAQPYYEKALTICRKVLGEEHPNTANSYHNLAINLAAQGKLAEAQPLCERALAIYRKVFGEEHPHTAYGYNNLAGNLDDQGKYAEAQPLKEKALAIRRKVLGEQHPDTATSYNNLANNLFAQGKYVQAEALFETALSIYRKVLGEEHRETARSCNNVAVSLNAQGKYAQAQLLYEKALAIFRKVLGEEHPDTAISYDSAAVNLDAQGKYAQAQPLHEKALAIFRKALGEEHPYTATSCNDLAANLKAQGKYAAAQLLYEEALTIYRKALGDQHPYTATSCNGVAVCLLKQRKVAEAVRLLRDSLPGQEAARFCRAASGFDRAIASAEHIDPQQLLAAGLAVLGKPAAAFRHAEAALSRGLLDDLAFSTSTDGKRLETLQSELAGLDKDLLPLFGQGRLSADGKARRAHLVERRQGVVAELTRVAADISSRQLLPLEEIQKALPEDAALLLWLDIDYLGVHHACVLRARGEPVWVRLDGTGEDGAWTARDHSLAQRLYAVLEQRTGPEADLRRLTLALTRQRLAPLEPHLGAGNGLPAVRRLLVVPTGWAALVPIEVLSDEYRVSYVPSGSFFARLHQQHRPIHGSSLLALGDPVFTTPADRGPDPLALPGSRWEVQTLSRLVPEAATLLGSDASQQRLDELASADKLKDFRLIHLATHASMDWDTPARSCLLLSRDRLPDPKDTPIGKAPITGELTVGAIRQRWHLDADLVVLSACQTALGRGGKGDGLLGFAQAFLQCGARSVVLSRWPASDTATALLMVRFYENLLAPPSRKDLKGPLGRAEALAEAKKWLRELPRRDVEVLAANLQAGKLSDTVTRLGIAKLNVKERPKLPEGEHPYAHPFFWATFVLIGDPD
jgi:CHAT domain-containing protein/tetratricopeptide (TPR) repeat protein